MENTVEHFHPVDCDIDYFIDHPREQDAFYAKAHVAPVSIRGLLFGNTTPRKIQTIAATHALTTSQTATVSRLVRNIAVSNTYLGAVVNEIIAQLGIADDRARRIANDLATLVLAPAMEDIKKLQAETFKDKILGNQAEAQKVAKVAGVSADNVLNLRRDKP